MWAAILDGRLIALCGMIGSGKTALLRHLQADLARENKVLVSKSLSVDQERCIVTGKVMVGSLGHNGRTSD